MPAPIQWEKCPTNPNGIECQAMAIPWTKDQSAVASGDAMMANVNGVAFLGFQRNGFDDPNPYFLHVIGPADGALTFAFLKIWISDSQSERRVVSPISTA